MDRRFSFSWADEVEREEKEEQQRQEKAEELWRRLQQQQEEEEENQPPRCGGEAQEQQTTKANPFGAARPREVVLAEKGVDWRARDRELELDASRREGASRRRRVDGSKRHAAVAPAPARRHDDSTPASRRLKISAPPAVRYDSACGGKRKCAGRDDLRRQVRPVADHCRSVFGQLNIGDGGDLSRCSGENQSWVGTERIVISKGKAAAVDGEIIDSGTVPVSAGTEKNGGCGAGQRREKKGSNKAKKQQTSNCRSWWCPSSQLLRTAH